MFLSVVIILGILAAAGVGYLVFIGLEAYAEVKAAPREEMLLCGKHGPIRQNGTIDFFGTKHCGLCFNEKLKRAERGELPL